MPRTKSGFTDTWLKGLLKKPPAQRVSYTEPSRPGFQLRHEQGGSLTFVLRYFRDGKEIVLNLGNYPSTTLEDAHDAHSEARKQLGRGIDPKDERERTAHAMQTQAQRDKVAGAVSARNVVAEWGWHYARKHRKHPREAIRLLKVYVATPWKGRAVRDLVKRDVVLLLDRITARAPVMANRIYNLGAQAFTFAVARDLITSSPWVGVQKPGGDEEARERTLTTDEVRAFWSGLDSDCLAISAPVRLALKLILVTAQRPGEVAGAAWTEFDLKRAVWTIPGTRTKNARVHEVPLTGLAVEILGELRELAGDRPRLLPSPHSIEKPNEAVSSRALSRALRNNYDKQGKLFGVEPFTPHDLRRTAASMMTSLGIQRLHVAKVLNHTDQDITGAVYDQHDYFAEKKLALQTLATELDGLIAGKRRKVVPIKRR